MHERPDPQAVEHLLAKLADLGVPTPPVPEAADAAAGGRARRRDLEARRGVRRSSRAAGREAFPALVLRALKQARYDPQQPRPLGPREHRVLPLHLADPPLSRPRRAPRAPARARPVGRPAAGGSPALAEHASEREREAAQIEYLADDICLAWLLERRLFERGWEERWDGEITGVIGSGLFVRFGEVFEGFLPARRLHGEFFELNELGTALVGRKTGRAYRLGDAVEVRVEKIVAQRGQGRAEARESTRRLDQAALVRPACQLVARRELELPQDARDVGLDGLDRQVQPRGDLLVAVAARDQLQHFPLARR